MVSFPQPHFHSRHIDQLWMCEHKTKCSLSGSLPAPSLYHIYPFPTSHPVPSWILSFHI